jgi:hypothetical protein
MNEKRHTKDKIAALALCTCTHFERLDILLSILLSFEETMPISWTWLREDLALSLYPKRGSLVWKSSQAGCTDGNVGSVETSIQILTWADSD